MTEDEARLARARERKNEAIRQADAIVYRWQETVRVAELQRVSHAAAGNMGAVFRNAGNVAGAALPPGFGEGARVAGQVIGFASDIMAWGCEQNNRDVLTAIANGAPVPYEWQEHHSQDSLIRYAPMPTFLY